MRNVKILDDVQKKAVYEGFLTSANKTALAKQFGVSVRTIGRVITEQHAKYNKPEPSKPLPVTDTSSKMIGSESFITLVLNGKIVTADSSHPNFEKAHALMVKGDIEGVATLLDTTEALKIYSKGNIKIIGHKVLYKDIVFDSGITQRIVREMYNDRPYEHLVNFFEKLMENPSRDAVYQLYGFLVHNDIELADDGDFYAWKRVREDFRDLASGKFDNSPGVVVEMPRNQVDEDKNRTCSCGLHVAAKSYLPHYGGGRGKVIQVKVNPRDVVAIPTDYDNAKMRVCRYQVMRDVTVGFSHY